MKKRSVIVRGTGEVLIPQAKWCDTFFSRLRGFTFTKPIGELAGLVLVNAKESRVDSSITMFFVSYDLGVIWVNDRGEVVDKVVAKPWRLSYAAKAPARYVIEGHPTILAKVALGEQITFAKETPKV